MEALASSLHAMHLQQVRPARSSAAVQLPALRPRTQQRLVVAAAAAVEAPPAAAPSQAAPAARDRKVSRRFAEQLAKVPGKETMLPPLDAIKLALSTASAKFDETVEVH